MKKLFFLLAGVFLLSGSAYCATSGETSANGQQIATLTFEFYQGPQGFMYICRAAPGYSVNVIDMWIHHVNLDKNGYSENDVTAWIQSQSGGEYSEIVPGSLTPDSYVDLSTIQVQTSGGPEYIYEFKFIGIDAR